MKERSYTIHFAVLMTALLLVTASCKIGQKYARPELNMPETTEPEPVDSLTVADIEWWELYTDTVLQGLIQTALENNKDVQMAAARLKQFWAYKKISDANMYPRLDVGVNAEQEMENYGGDNRELDPEIQVRGSVSWELDLWGNIRWGKEAAYADYFASVEAQRALQMSIVAEVAQAYFTLIALDDELRIVQKTVESRVEGARIANLRFSGGLTSETSVQQAQVELANTKTLVPALESNIRATENQLAMLMGAYDNSIVRGIGLRDQEYPETLPVGLPSDLLVRRPDIREAEQRLVAANAMVGVAVTNRFPRIALTTDFGLENDDLGNLLKSPFWFVAGEVLTPVFAAGKLKNEQRISEAVYEQEIYAYQKIVLQAFHEVNTAIVVYNKAQEVTRAQRNLVRAASEYQRLGVVQYLNGAIGYLDLLDAQRSLLNAEIDLNNSRRDELIALVDLYKALGGGWMEGSAEGYNQPEQANN